MRKFDNLLAGKRIDISDEKGHQVTVYAQNGDIILRTKDKEISVNSLINRLDALETAYMEDKLLGSTSGKIDE